MVIFLSYGKWMGRVHSFSLFSAFTHFWVFLKDKDDERRTASR